MAANIEQINTLVDVVGIASILVSVGIAWGRLNTSVKKMQKTLDLEIKPDLKQTKKQVTDLREQFIELREQFMGLRERYVVTEEQMGKLLIRLALPSE